MGGNDFRSEIRFFRESFETMLFPSRSALTFSTFLRLFRAPPESYRETLEIESNQADQPGRPHCSPRQLVGILKHFLMSKEYFYLNSGGGSCPRALKNVICVAIDKHLSLQSELDSTTGVFPLFSAFESDTARCERNSTM